jgi:WD40 repeat protein
MIKNSLIFFLMIFFIFEFWNFDLKGLEDDRESNWEDANS